MRPWAPLCCTHRGTVQTFHATPKNDNEKIGFFKIQWNFVLTVIVLKIYSQRIYYLTFLGFLQTRPSHIFSMLKFDVYFLNSSLVIMLLIIPQISVSCFKQNNLLLQTCFHVMPIFLLFKILACIFAFLIDICSMLNCHQCAKTVSETEHNCENSEDLGVLVTCQPNEVCKEVKFKGRSNLSSSRGLLKMNNFSNDHLQGMKT